jgi:sulfur-carrier protein
MNGQAVKLVYFAWVRERIGLADETLIIPTDIITIADLARWLAKRSDGHARAFENPDVVRAAIDKIHARTDTPIAGAHEVAFFPPMTGG